MNDLIQTFKNKRYTNIFYPPETNLKIIRLIGYVLLHYYFGKDHKQYDFSSFQHHERLDGSGYPLGIKRLNKYSHLIGIVDILDALISERPYRKKLLRSGPP